MSHLWHARRFPSLREAKRRSNPGLLLRSDRMPCGLPDLRQGYDSAGSRHTKAYSYIILLPVLCKDGEAIYNTTRTTPQLAENIQASDQVQWPPQREQINDYIE
jgi:hypothetical protein